MIALALIFFAAATLGLTLLVRGLRWRRRGDTPHCAKCDYVLTGLDAPRCPECGSKIDHQLGVALGDRYRRPYLAWAGVGVVGFTILSATLAFSDAVRSIDWYQFCPTGWVLDDLEKSKSARAMRELQRRYAAGSLSVANRERLIGLALAEQATSMNTLLTSDYLSFLGDVALAEQLSSSQRRLFFDQILQVTLSTRPQAGLKDFLPFRFSYASRGPGDGWWIGIEMSDAEFAGAKSGLGGSSSFSGNGAGGASGSSILASKLGVHTLSVKAKTSVYYGADHDASKAKVMHQHDAVYKTKVEVLANRPEVIEHVVDASLAQVIMAALSPDSFRLQGQNLTGNIKVVAPLRGFFVAFGYTRDAEDECRAFYKRTKRIIKLLTVQEILDEEHLQKM